MNPIDALLPTHAMFHAAAAHDPVNPVDPVQSIRLQELQDRINAFQRRAFPDQTIHGKLAHLTREAQELRDNPEDLSEWADVLILLLGAAALADLTAADLVNACAMKMTINESRRWGPADSEGVHHHIN